MSSNYRRWHSRIKTKRAIDHEESSLPTAKATDYDDLIKDAQKRRETYKPPSYDDLPKIEPRRPIDLDFEDLSLETSKMNATVSLPLSSTLTSPLTSSLTSPLTSSLASTPSSEKPRRRVSFDMTPTDIPKSLTIASYPSSTPYSTNTTTAATTPSYTSSITPYSDYNLNTHNTNSYSDFLDNTDKLLNRIKRESKHVTSNPTLESSFSVSGSTNPLTTSLSATSVPKRYGMATVTPLCDPRDYEKVPIVNKSQEVSRLKDYLRQSRLARLKNH